MKPPLTAALFACAGSLLLATAHGQSTATGSPSTRIDDSKQHSYVEAGRYPFRRKSEFILEQLDLKPGDVVVDIGAGDGWWSRQFAEQVGEQGIVHAAEVDERLVARMKRDLAELPQIKPYRCPTDGTALEEDTCDVAFLAQTYHHLDADGRERYLHDLKSVLRPTGRLCVVEKHSGISTRSPAHGTFPTDLVATAEKAGWVLVRFELMPRTYHYLAIFAQRELFPAEPERRQGRRRGRTPERPAVEPAPSLMKG